MIRSRISLLLRELGHTPTFHDSVNSILDLKFDSIEAGNTVLFHLGEDDGTIHLNALSRLNSAVQVVGFVPFDGNDMSKAPVKPEGLSNYLLLPPHGERAKTRLKQALKNVQPTAPSQRRLTKIPFNVNKRTTSSFTGNSITRFAAQATSAAIQQKETKYFTAQSPASKTFIKKIASATDYTALSLLTGYEGCEFELAARELVHQINGPDSELHFITSLEFDLATLERKEKFAKTSKTMQFCYLGRTDELTSEGISQVADFCEFLSCLKNPYVRLILAHEIDSEMTFRNGVKEILWPLIGKAKTFEIPALRDRPEDIKPIGQTLLANLRLAHTFLGVTEISNDAYDYFLNNRYQFSHAKMIRVLRNAIALSQRPIITEQELHNYGEHDQSTSHLVESMADERYFPYAPAINS